MKSPFYVDPTTLGVHGVPDTAKYSCAPCNQRLCLFEDCEVLLDRIAKLDYVLTDDVSDELDIFQSRLRRLRRNCNKYFAHLGRDAQADKYQASVSKYKYGEKEEKGSDHFGKKSASMCGVQFVRLPENATDPNIREETFMNLWSADSEQNWYKYVIPQRLPRAAAVLQQGVHCAAHPVVSRRKGQQDQEGWASRTRQGQGTVADRFRIRAEAY